MMDSTRKESADCDEIGPCNACADDLCPWHPSSDDFEEGGDE